MLEEAISELWDFIAQQFRDTIAGARPEELEYHPFRDEYSISELAWQAIGTCYRWSVVLAGATTVDEAVEMNPRAIDLLQAASGGYTPGRFPTTMPAESDEILDRADDVLAAVGAHLMEFGAAERELTYRTWWHGSLTGDEIAARLLWTLGHADGQIRLLIGYCRRPHPS